VTWSLEDGALRLTGTADQAWIDDARENARSIPGVNSLEASGLRPTKPPLDWDLLVERFATEPGYVITMAQWHGGRYQLSGLRDPLSRPWQEIVGETHLPADQLDVAWKPFHSLEQPMLEQRLRLLLAAPAEVRVDLEGDRVIISGEASHRWREQLGAKLAAIGDDALSLDDSQLEIREQRELADLIRIVDEYELEATLGSGFNAADRRSLKTVAAVIGRLAETARVSGHDVYIDVIGETSGKGTEEALRQRSWERAVKVRRELIGLGVRPELLEARIIAKSTTAAGDTASPRRHVTLQARLADRE
jgi:OOP family OmpA-OmpF porin